MLLLKGIFCLHIPLDGRQPKLGNLMGRTVKLRNKALLSEDEPFHVSEV